jgi:hypothetical protein
LTAAPRAEAMRMKAMKVSSTTTSIGTKMLAWLDASGMI